MTEEKESGAESDDVLQAAEKSFNEDKREDEWRNGIRERNRNTVWKGGQGGMDLSTRDRNIQKTQKLKGIIKRMADNERDSLLSGIKQLDLNRVEDPSGDLSCGFDEVSVGVAGRRIRLDVSPYSRRTTRI
eukprot:GHVU01070290.1.p2 GENE.GHVU01070290.1~~GHVU01070290.1.p2  ORF type:complete len:131 (-),score=19.34 GHVU01070290.1:233-625(-)